MERENKIALIITLTFFIGYIASLLGDKGYLGVSVVIYLYVLPLMTLVKLIRKPDLNWLATTFVWVSMLQNTFKLNSDILFSFYIIGALVFWIANFKKVSNTQRWIRGGWVLLVLSQPFQFVFNIEYLYHIVDLVIIFLLFIDGKKTTYRDQQTFIWVIGLFITMRTLLEMLYSAQ